MNLFAGQQQRHGCREWTCKYGEWGRGEGEAGTTESNINIPTFTTMCKIATGKLLYNTGSLAWCSVMTQGVRWQGGRLKKEEIYVYLTADSSCSTTETNATLQSNCTLIKILNGKSKMFLKSKFTKSDVKGKPKLNYHFLLILVMKTFKLK